MSGPVEFLKAAHKRTEDIARIIGQGGFEPQTWHTMPSRSGRWVWVYSKSRLIGEPPEAATRYSDQPVALVQTGRNEHLHIEQHDPDSVLRRVAAERKILAEHADDGGDCRVCADETTGDEDSEGNRDWYRTAKPYPCRTVRLLAEGYGWTEETT